MLKYGFFGDGKDFCVVGAQTNRLRGGQERNRKEATGQKTGASAGITTLSDIN